VSTEQGSEALTGGKGARSGQVRRGERRRKTNRAPVRLVEREMEARRQRESVRTQQEWSRLKRIREECEAAEERACRRSGGCKPGGKFPPGLIGQVAMAKVDRTRAEEERISRKQVVQEAMVEGVAIEEGDQGSTRGPGNLTESGEKRERKSAARYAVEDVGNMPMRETGEVGRDADEQVDEQGAGVDPLDTSRRARQLRLNEQGGKKCICGRWEDYARVDGGWASSRLGDEWGEAGEHGCENVAAGELEMNEKLCLLCQAGQ
jgi:hypothetical protein